MRVSTIGKLNKTINKIKQDNYLKDLKEYGEEFFKVNRTKGKIIFSKKQRDYIINTYKKPHEDASSIAKRFGVSYPIISKHLNYWGIPKKSVYKLHTDKYNRFFETIDTEEKAYWLGFLFADCSLAKNYLSSSQKKKGVRDGGKTYMRISLQGEDKTHLEKLAVALGLSEDRVKLETYYMESVKREYTYANLSVYDSNLVDDLIDKGMQPAHSLKEDSRKEFMMFPVDKIDKKLMRHFIRGYFDGDGSLTCAKRKGKYMNTKHYTIKFLGNEKICRFLKDYFNITTLNSKQDSSNVYKNKNKGFVWSYEKGGNHNTFLHLSELYEGATISLGRKQEKVNEFFKYFCERNESINNRPTNERKKVDIK